MRTSVWIFTAMAALLFASAGAGNGPIKIGFLVKQPEEPWFQTEWKFAQKAADENGFTLIKIGVPDGDQVMNALDSLNVQGASGFVICTPDPKLGRAIVAKAGQLGLKFMTVDDQFVSGDGTIMSQVHHLGMSPGDIGRQAGEIEIAEMKKRGWSVADTAVIVSSYVQLDTARQRTDGAQAALIDGGIPKDKLFDAPNKRTSLEDSFDAANAVLVQHPEVKHWLIVGMNDNAVLGPVRATESHGIAAADVIGVGINGTDCHAELAKPQATGFFGSLLLSPNKHGYETTMMVYHWVKDGIEPPMATFVRKATFINRDNWQQALRDQGMM
jgi:L-arabinose transport system substrate-binding protein